MAAERDTRQRRTRKPTNKVIESQENDDATEGETDVAKAAGGGRTKRTTVRGSAPPAKVGWLDSNSTLEALQEQMKEHNGLLKTALVAGQAQIAIYESMREDNRLLKHEPRAVSDELRKVKDELVAAKTESGAIKDEIGTIRADLRTIEAKGVEEAQRMQERLDAVMAVVSGQSSPNPSYAEVARTPPTSQPTNIRTFSSMNTTPSTFTDTLFCTVDTSRVEEADRSKVHAGTVRMAVEMEMRTRREDDSWKCKAVTVDAKNASRIKIVCRDETEHNMVKQAAERMELASGVRVFRDELYPVKFDNVNRTAVLGENGNIRPGAAQVFGQENEATVAKMSWLSQKDIPKAYGSMVVYLTKAADAGRVLQERYFHAGGESGYTSVFERRPRPEQCYNCQEIGHKAFKCRKAQKCARCAQEGHRHDECREEVLKCVPCGGPHESFSKSCPKLYPGQHE
ncbi:reverse transcriptase [Verticillium dahliae]